MTDSVCREQFLHELTAALRVYAGARPEHYEAAATHLKRTVVNAHSAGVLDHDDTALFMRLPGLRKG